MAATFFCKVFSKISGKSSADTGIAFKKADHVVYSLDLKVFLIFEQCIHFFRHLIDIKGLGQKVVYVHRLPGLEFNPALFFKVFQGGQNPLPVRIIAVKDGLDVYLCPYLLGMAMFQDRVTNCFRSPSKLLMIVVGSVMYLNEYSRNR